MSLRKFWTKIDSAWSGIVLDSYEKESGVYVDSLGNSLTYFAWGIGQPNTPMTGRYTAMNNESNGWNDLGGHHIKNVVCVKCLPSYYRGPQTFLKHICF